MGAQARQNRRGNEMLQLHGKITHQEKLTDARRTNKPTKTKSIYKQAKPTDRQQTGSWPTGFGAVILVLTLKYLRPRLSEFQASPLLIYFRDGPNRCAHRTNYGTILI